MLQIIGITEPHDEVLEVEYVVSIKWRRVWGSTIYWRTGDLQRSFIEIGYNQPDGRLVDVTLLLATEVVPWSEDYTGIANLCASQQSGLPVCNASAWPPDERYVDDPGPLRLVLGQNRLSIQFAEPSQATSCISTRYVDFGVKADGALCVIEVRDLSDAQMASVRLTFPTSRG
jgi:hypothetical protein